MRLGLSLKADKSHDVSFMRKLCFGCFVVLQAIVTLISKVKCVCVCWRFEVTATFEIESFLNLAQEHVLKR
ncbi:hypothetical protein C0081_13535 [Cohaesibacter celericrescens]|uniref:Uncharacterized protein n=1 Tax=Cohaesibacter celericrescens TaxID=2067669 RepID=A0A2N5XRA8_9HYPH|nr:hypothetical protein C0081_13535 [Cohaesibacter celericrescens]